MNYYILKAEYSGKLQRGLPDQDFDDIFQKSVIVLHNNMTKVDNPKAFLYETIRLEIISWKGTKYYKKTDYVDVLPETQEENNLDNKIFFNQILKKIMSLSVKSRQDLLDYLNDCHVNDYSSKVSRKYAIDILKLKIKGNTNE